MEFPIEFTIPPGWRTPVDGTSSALGTVVAGRPEHDAVIVADGGLRPDKASLAEIAEETVTAIRESGTVVEVLHREELGTAASPGFAQILLARDAAETVQCQTFIAMLDLDDSSERAVLRLVLVTPKEHVAALVGDFQQFLSIVRPPAPTAERHDKKETDHRDRPGPRHTRAATGEDSGLASPEGKGNPWHGR